MNDMTVNIEDASQDKFAAVLNGELALIAEQRLEDAKSSSAGSSRDGNSSYQFARAMNLASFINGMQVLRGWRIPCFGTLSVLETIGIWSCTGS
ncbi:MAG: hypothetical protein KKH74_02230 [Gammaproteobacteria bacterium]|nr:hypothetical protein [Gammaproteobacteria bacterium]MBU1730938.1 hypothetical protein [Gammaproteobacteria bacterium]MBU1893598.1 hypothetical protein [Gammaproteobacteria bacterium]